MSAATELAAASDEPVFRPIGQPVRGGRLHLGRVRHRLPVHGPIVVVVGFAAVAWLGAPDDPVPGLGRLTYRSETRIDRRGRAVLDRRTRAWLAVTDPAAFDAEVMPVSTGGVVVVPVESYARRIAEVKP